MPFIDMAAIDAAIAPLSDTVGFPPDQAKFVLCMLVAVLLGFVHLSLPNNPTLKHVFSLFWGVSFSVFCFGDQTIHAFVISAVTYVIALLFRNSHCHLIGFVWCLGYLSCNHIYRILYDYGGWTLDITGPLMVLTIKLSSFAFNVRDGARLEQCTPEQRLFALERVPTVLEFFSFCFYFGGFLAGPAFECRDYLRFTDRTLHKHPLPSTVWPALRALIISFVCLGIFLGGGKHSQIDRLREDEFLVMEPFWWRVGYMMLVTSLQRPRYYFGWVLAESNLIAAGLGYAGKDARGNDLWDRCNNIDIVGMESSQNFKSVTGNWNKATAAWLRRYVYTRLTPEGRKPTLFQTAVTYGVSAFWHGFYSAYYLMFFSAALCTELAKATRRHLRPHVMEADGKTGKPGLKLAYDIFSFVVTHIAMNYMCAVFLMLNLHDSLRLWGSFYWGVHVVTIIGLVYFNTIGGSPKKRPLAATPAATSQKMD